jgi:hypothetical protein
MTDEPRQQPPRPHRVFTNLSEDELRELEAFAAGEATAKASALRTLMVEGLKARKARDLEQ